MTPSLLFLSGLLVVPLVKLEPAFDQNRTPFLQILADGFGLTAESVHINESHFLALFAGFGGPVAINRKTEFSNGGSLGSVAQFRIARQVPGQDDFVEVGHNRGRLLHLGLGRGRDGKQDAENFLVQREAAAELRDGRGLPSKITFT